MPDTTDPAGRRANGLQAADWGALVDLDPRLSGGLLDRLAAAGVAAYVEPASAVDTVHRAVTMPSRPLDRLWVDPDRAEQARAVVASEVADLTALLAESEPGATAHGLVQPVPRSAARRVLPPPALPDPPAPPAAEPPAPATPSVPSDDDVFAALVAQFHRTDDDDGPHGWPVAEDLPRPPVEPYRRRTDPPPPPDAAAGPPKSPPAAAPQGPAKPPPPVLRRGSVPLPGWLEPEPVEDDGHYVPPPPPPVPRLRVRTVVAVLAVLVGLVLLFVPQLVRLSATTGTGVLGLALLSGGAAALVWWMRDSSDSGPDDGAVV